MKPSIEMFDSVRIGNSQLTREKKVADLTGIVYGVTTPSETELRELTGVEYIIGEDEAKEDVAYGVYFEERDEVIWFAPHLVIFVSHNPGQEIKLGNAQYTRLDSGEWQKENGLKKILRTLWEKISSF